MVDAQAWCDMHRIATEVGAAHGFTLERLRRRRRDAETVYARRLAIQRIDREVIGRKVQVDGKKGVVGTTDVARFFGFKDHGTILHNRKTAEMREKSNAARRQRHSRRKEAVK